MPCTAGNSSFGVLRVQSPVAETMSSGRGAIIAPNIYQQLLERKLPMRLIGQDPRRVIVANDPAPAAATGGEKKAAK